MIILRLGSLTRVMPGIMDSYHQEELCRKLGEESLTIAPRLMAEMKSDEEMFHLLHYGDALQSARVGIACINADNLDKAFKRVVIPA